LSRKQILIIVFVHVLFALIIGLFLSSYLAEQRARRSVLAAVVDCSTVLVNGQMLADPAPLLSALRQTKFLPPNHTGPGRAIALRLGGLHGTTDITLARDSDHSDQFWVFGSGRNWENYPGGQLAGRFISADLDLFLKSLGL